MPKKMTTLESAKLELTLHRFNFEEVHNNMVRMDWPWASATTSGELTYAIPDIDKLKAEAERLLECAFETGYCATGGFVARWDSNDFYLEFVITSSDSYIEGEDTKNTLENIKDKKAEISNTISALDI